MNNEDDRTAEEMEEDIYMDMLYEQQEVDDILDSLAYRNSRLGDIE